MKVILHIGLPKTGSTSIQATLSRSRSQLKRRGVFYPRIGLHENHNLLSLPFQKNLPRTLGKLSKAEKSQFRAEAIACWERLGKEAASQKPRVVLLSSEYFAFVTRPKKLIETVVTTFPDAERIEVVAYLRRPSEHYVSLAQQKLKGTSTLPVPKRIEYAKVLAPFAAGCALSIREMHPRLLVDGDIVADFFETFLSVRSQEIPSRAPRKNESVSAEAMALLQEFRRHAFPGQDHRLNAETTRVLEAIRAVEAKHGGLVGFSRPHLHKDLAEHLDYATSDNRALRKRFGFTFCDLDRKRVGSTSVESTSFDGTQYRSVADIVTLDPEKLEILRSLVLKELATRKLELAWISKKIARLRRI